jgi:hypothetical protein
MGRQREGGREGVRGGGLEREGRERGWEGMHAQGMHALMRRRHRSLLHLNRSLLSKGCMHSCMHSRTHAHTESTV